MLNRKISKCGSLFIVYSKPLGLFLLGAIVIVWMALTVGRDGGTDYAGWKIFKSGQNVRESTKESGAYKTNTAQEFQLSNEADATPVQPQSHKSGSQLSMPATHIPPGYSSEIIQVKFREGTDVNPPETTLPPDLRNSVTSMTRLFSLPEEKLGEIGAGRFRLWFEITLNPGTDAVNFLENLKQLDSVEIAEPAPLPSPPPAP